MGIKVHTFVLLLIFIIDHSSWNYLTMAQLWLWTDMLTLEWSIPMQMYTNFSTSFNMRVGITIRLGKGG